MEIDKIKISVEFMKALIDKFFTREDINFERKKKNAENIIKRACKPWNPEYNEISMLEVSVNSKIRIPLNKVDEYFKEWEKILYGDVTLSQNKPYFSLVSDNCTNELRVGLRSVEMPDMETLENIDDVPPIEREFAIKCQCGEVPGDDMDCLSKYYETDENGKYLFIN